jgi:hypothetical protein
MAHGGRSESLVVLIVSNVQSLYTSNGIIFRDTHLCPTKKVIIRSSGRFHRPRTIISSCTYGTSSTTSIPSPNESPKTPNFDTQTSPSNDPPSNSSSNHNPRKFGRTKIIPPEQRQANHQLSAFERERCWRDIQLIATLSYACARLYFGGGTVEH